MLRTGQPASQPGNLRLQRDAPKASAATSWPAPDGDAGAAHVLDQLAEALLHLNRHACTHTHQRVRWGGSLGAGPQAGQYQATAGPSKHSNVWQGLQLKHVQAVEAAMSPPTARALVQDGEAGAVVEQARHAQPLLLAQRQHLAPVHHAVRARLPAAQTSRVVREGLRMAK